MTEDEFDKKYPDAAISFGQHEKFDNEPYVGFSEYGTYDLEILKDVIKVLENMK